MSNSLTTYQNKGSVTSREEYAFTYDTKINPFYGVYVIPTYFGGISNSFVSPNTVSRNNLTSVGGITYRYEYNAANLPTVRYTITDRIAETLRFEYETY